VRPLHFLSAVTNKSLVKTNITNTQYLMHIVVMTNLDVSRSGVQSVFYGRYEFGAAVGDPIPTRHASFGMVLRGQCWLQVEEVVNWRSDGGDCYFPAGVAYRFAMTLPRRSSTSTKSPARSRPLTGTAVAERQRR